MHDWMLKFADDTKIFSCIKDSMDNSKMQKDLDTIIEWADKWQMKFNVNKCKVMHAGKANSKKPYCMRENILQELIRR